MLWTSTQFQPTRSGFNRKHLFLGGEVLQPVKFQPKTFKTFFDASWRRGDCVEHSTHVFDRFVYGLPDRNFISSIVQGGSGRSVLTQKFCRTSTKKLLYFHKNIKMTKINESRNQKFFIQKIRNN